MTKSKVQSRIDSLTREIKTIESLYPGKSLKELPETERRILLRLAATRAAVRVQLEIGVSSASPDA